MIHRWPVRVYYEDVDLGGIVYYANYLKFFERGRTEALRAAGVDQRALKDADGLVFVVTRIAVDYRAPARFDDMLTVETRLTRLGAASADMAQTAARDGAILAQAHVRLALIDAARRPARLPPALRAALDAGAPPA